MVWKEKENVEWRWLKLETWITKPRAANHGDAIAISPVPPAAIEHDGITAIRTLALPYLTSPHHESSTLCL